MAAPVAQVPLQSTQRRPELEDSTLRYLQDLLAWVEENQRRIDSAEWGVDLPSVEAQLGSHRGMHQSVEEFRAKIERARNDEVRSPLGVGSGCGPARSPCATSPPHPATTADLTTPVSCRASSPLPPEVPTETAWVAWTCSMQSCW